MGNGEIELWRAVILQAIKDAVCCSVHPQDKASARRWLSGGSIDFELVCELAEIDSNAIREKFLKMRINDSK